MMKGLTRARVFAPALLTAALAGSLIPAASSLASRAHASPIYLVAIQNFKTTMTRDFNLFDPAGRMDWVDSDIYEPLYIINVPPATNGKSFPWLATSYAWSNGNKTLTFTIRHGVKWSDGQPFTAQDVAFTLNYGKKFAVADQQGLWGSKALQSVTASGDKVTINLTNVDTTILRKIANLVLILPQHIWSKVTNPATFRNPNPVGTGPFTQVTDFSTQSFVLAKNPYYWQPLSYDGIKVPSFTGNDAANLAMTEGQLDWTGNFVPNIQKAYVAKDPAHFHYDYAPGAPVGLWFNNTQYPYSLVAFRKAVSLAINRDQVANIGEYGYAKPADASGIIGPWPKWADPSLTAQAQAEAAYNPAEAKDTLTKAGFTYKGSQLIDPKGNPVSVTFSVISGWSDWILSLQIIQSDLKKIGINASVKIMQQAQWTDAANKGTLPGGDGQLHWVNTGPTPYEYFYGYMSQESYTPIGTDATLNGQGNYERWSSPQVSALLKQFRSTTDAATQHKAINQIEAIQLNQLPYIPVFYGADWYTYSTLHFTGWPTPDNFYTAGSLNDHWATWKVLTTIKPVQS